MSKIFLYNSAGTSVIYTFPLVQTHNGPKYLKKTTVINNFNASTEIILTGGLSAWDWVVNFYIVGENYDEIEEALYNLNTTVVIGTPYLLKILRNGGNYYNYKVKRLLDFEYENSLRNGYGALLVTGTFRVNAW
jgi:hypothetical protein